jgi:hypothetical protein
MTKKVVQVGFALTPIFTVVSVALPARLAIAATPSHVVLSYLSTAAAPTAFPPDCPSEPIFGVLGVCLDTPIARLRQQFGIEDQTQALGSGRRLLSWTFDGITVTSVVGRAGTALSLRVVSHGKTRVALPRHMILGTTTFASAERALGGKPLRRTVDAAEMLVFYNYTWYSGCLGSCFQTFGWTGTYARSNPFDRLPTDIEIRRPNEYSVCEAATVSDTGC